MYKQLLLALSIVAMLLWNTVLTALLLLLLLNGGCAGGGDPEAPPPVVAQQPAAPVAPEKAAPVHQPAPLSNTPPAQPATVTIVESPPGSTQATVQNGTAPTITPDVPGTYVVEVSTTPEQPPTTVTIIAEEHVVRLAFSAPFGGGLGNVSGTFAYDSAMQPQASNVRGLQPNAEYALRDWELTVDGGTIAPSTTYKRGAPGNAAVFCVGQCILSPTQALRLFFTNESASTLEIVYAVVQPGTALPFDLEQWGPFRFAVYRGPVIAVMETATLQAVLPVAATE